MSHNKAICLPDGTKMDWLEKGFQMFLNKSIILYGLTGSGKSSIVINILYALRNHISYPFVITKSAASAEENYIGRIPRGCIKLNITKQWLETFISKQSDRTKIYNCVNKLENLKHVFNLIDNPTAAVIEAGIINDAERCMQSVELNSETSFPKKKTLIDSIRRARDEVLTNLYKRFIRAYRVELENIQPDLSKKSRLVINYLDFMPHSLLIFDDCAFMIKIWVKETPAIKELFYQGRHIYTTIILATQSDKEIDSEIRKNANITIFTTAQDATCAFGRGSNSFPDRDKKKAQMCCNAVFAPDGISSRDNHQKLIYVRDDNINPFKYTIADAFDDNNNFKMGASCVWALDEYLYPQDESKAYESSIFDKYC